MIILDIDGVVADYFSELVHIIRTAGWEVHDWNEWNSLNWAEVIPDLDSDVVELLFSNPMLAKNCRPFEESWYWVNHYSSIYDIMYVTSRDQSLTQYTWDWFFSWDIPADFVVFEKNKSDFIKNLQVNVYVDDVPEFVVDARKSGVNAFLMNRSYNLNYDIDPQFRINSLWDITCV